MIAAVRGLLKGNSTLGLAMIAAVRGLLKGVGGRLEFPDDKDSVSIIVPLP